MAKKTRKDGQMEVQIIRYDFDGDQFDVVFIIRNDGKVVTYDANNDIGNSSPSELSVMTHKSMDAALAQFRLEGAEVVERIV